MAGLQGRFAAKANPMQQMMEKKKAEEAERNAKLQKKAKMAARIAALGIQDEKLTATEKEAKRRASISLQCQAMSFEKNDIDPKMKRMMRSEFAGLARVAKRVLKFRSVQVGSQGKGLLPLGEDAAGAVDAEVPMLQHAAIQWLQTVSVAHVLWACLKLNSCPFYRCGPSPGSKTPSTTREKAC